MPNINTNNLERDFQISKHHLICQRGNLMGFTIVSGKKPIKCQIFILKRNILKNKCDGVDDPTIRNFYKIDNRKF